VAPGVTKAGGVCERTVDFMSIYPTLTDLAGIATPAHVEGKSIRTLLADPLAPWSQPAVTTFGYGNHAARSEGWRYIRYASGDEELYDEATDPYEWTNLAGEAKYDQHKTELAKSFPAGGAPAVEGKQPGRKKARKAQRADRAAAEGVDE
jgi:arylsulfatase A-like enzyme